jgi:NADH:ubiquinone oxidoreductase subunit 5 (subunit L)/multisubunit Na+/H+ antiporter MnhA subunit
MITGATWRLIEGRFDCEDLGRHPMRGVREPVHILRVLRLQVRQKLDRVSAMTARNGLTRGLYRASRDKWWFDDLNHLVFYRFGGRLADGVMWFDVRVIDGIVNGVGSVTQSIGDGIRHVQTGRVQNYALGIAVGLVVVAILFLLMAR